MDGKLQTRLSGYEHAHIELKRENVHIKLMPNTENHINFGYNTIHIWQLCMLIISKRNHRTLVKTI
jgi:hypothetical protein